MVLRDLRFALRQFTKNPGYALAVVLTLALAIGVNTAVFSMVDGSLLRSLPFRDPQRVAALILHVQGVSQRNGQYFSEDNDSHDGAVWLAVQANVRSADLAASIAGIASFLPTLRIGRIEPAETLRRE